jgi:hypothetical protein
LALFASRGSRAEQREASDDLLEMDHLARYVLGDGECDNLHHIIDVCDHAARLGTGETAEVST